MEGRAKPDRPYHSPLRQAQARRTRHDVLEATRRLMVARGYSGATIAEIARAAQVSPETVYAAFGSKRELLKELIVATVRGDESETPLLERPGPQAVRDASDQAEQLRLFAGDITTILDRVAPLMEIAESAARREPEIAQMVRRLHDARLDNMRRMVGWVEARGILRPGLAADDAAETAWALASPALYCLMTRTRGWSRERYAEWLASSLTRLLLPSNRDTPDEQLP